MKILGFVLCLIGIGGGIYVMTETRIDFGSSFVNFSLLILWYILTLGVGKALITAGEDNNKDDE